MDIKCYTCKHARSVPGDCHIACSHPDPNVKGATHAIINGWFFYPICYDPIWMITECSNYEEISK